MWSVRWVVEAMRRRSYILVLFDEIEKRIPMCLTNCCNFCMKVACPIPGAAQSTLRTMTSNIGSKVIERGWGSLCFEFSGESVEEFSYTRIRCRSVLAFSPWWLRHQTHTWMLQILVNWGASWILKILFWLRSACSDGFRCVYSLVGEGSDLHYWSLAPHQVTWSRPWLMQFGKNMACWGSCSIALLVPYFFVAQPCGVCPQLEVLNVNACDAFPETVQSEGAHVFDYTVSTTDFCNLITKLHLLSSKVSCWCSVFMALFSCRDRSSFMRTQCGDELLGCAVVRWRD